MARSKRYVQVRAGRLVSAVIYDQPTAADEPKARAAKQKISSEARRRLNRKQSRQKLEALLHANFTGSDLFVTLTFRDEDLPGTREGALRVVGKYIKMLRGSRAARGERLIYVLTVEHIRDDGTEGRWHAHLIVNRSAGGNDYEELRSLWARWGDNVEIEALGSDAQAFTARAAYMSKERCPNGKRCWTCCQGLARPVTTSELVDEALTIAPPPGAVVLEQETMSNNWGSFLYIKYVLPEPPQGGRRRRPGSAFFQSRGSVYLKDTE